jgi:F420-dependent oxidoreductase-like protein
MRLGLHPMNFTWPGGPAAIAPTLDHILRDAEAAGLHSFWPMDHFFQIGVVGPPEQPMPEVYSTLSWVAARTTTLQLGAMVTGVHHRHPGLLVKAVTTLDVLSGGRAWLGIGAGWNEEESRGLGVPYPALAERFEQLEETLRIARQMFDGDSSPFAGRHYTLDRPLNQPPPVRRPPILVGGSGEQKTMRLVARYADACNFFEWRREPEGLKRKFDVLRLRCDEAGRPYDDVVRTTTGRLGDLDLDAARRRLDQLAEWGVDLAVLDLPVPHPDGVFEYLAELVRHAEPLGRPSPALLG